MTVEINTITRVTRRVNCMSCNWRRHDHPRSIVTDHYLLDSEGVLIPDSLSPANNDLEKASISAPGISLYVSSDRKVATKY